MRGKLHAVRLIQSKAMPFPVQTAANTGAAGGTQNAQLLIHGGITVLLGPGLVSLIIVNWPVAGTAGFHKCAKPKHNSGQHRNEQSVSVVAQS